MTGCTTNPLVDMNAVIKIDKIGKVMNPGPLNSLSGPPALTDRFEIRTISENLGMAIHAGFSGRYASKGRRLDRGVTVTAINPFISCMVFMAELDRLFPRYVRLGHIGGTIHLGRYPEQSGNDEEGTKYGDPGDRIGAGVENLGHGIERPSWKTISRYPARDRKEISCPGLNKSRRALT